jgi:ABC-type uncharacterized transport system auxiliary subunit
MEANMRAAILFLLLTMACLAGAGCADTRRVHYYTLASAEPRVIPDRPDGPTILVAGIAASEPLQDARIRYRAGANEESAYEFHHWTERPGAMVRDGLIQALRSSGKYQRVLEASSSAPGDYLLRGRLHEFDEVDNHAIQTRISLHLDMVDKRTNRIIWDHLFERDEPVSGKSIKEVVASMDRNLARIASQAAAEIERFFAGRKLS